ncbi:cell division cycle-associated 7-like protein isoform X2 [Salvia hispanica]|uniref:cell division cycle-associated 7-like protein isoform X2 n=1 Tax=Salvia hispanica TaxID=49212 RepID=UPI002009BC63|nr:cell division cycle-associated 7-like protein isoform X2 [Salvia hispanica]
MKENFRCWISEYYTDMAVEASLGNYVASPSAKNVKSTGKSDAGSQVSNFGDRVYCHQCRQKTRAPAAACKNLTKKKPCSVKMCCRCLWNRYGEKVEEVASLEEWKCPKCRGICNCSVCMRRKGLQPMGVLTRAAKATGKDVLSARKKGKESLDIDDNTSSKRMKHSKLAETSYTIREEIVLPVETGQTFKLC